MSRPRRISELTLEISPSVSDSLVIVNNNESKRTTVGSLGSTILDSNLPVSASSIEVNGSVNINDVLSLSPQDPLPTGELGHLAVSGSNLYFYNGSWTLVV